MIRRNAMLLFCLLATTGVHAATTAQIDDVRAKGLAWLVKNQKGDGAWFAHDSIKVQSTASALEAMINAGMVKGETYSTAVAWLANAQPVSADSQARRNIALFRAGLDVSQSMTGLLGMRTKIYSNNTWDGYSWGAYDQYSGSLPDTALAMDAIAATNTTDADLGYSISFLATIQNADGGYAYAYFDGATAASKLVPTAHALITLSRYKLKGYALNADAQQALNWLIATGRQKADGSFADDPYATAGNPYDTALVYLALEEARKAGITDATVTAATAARAAAQDYLVIGTGKPQADGSWKGDPLTTALALKTLPATTLADSDGDGIPDAVETALADGSSTGVADGRSNAVGNGLGVIGIHTPLQLPGATVGQAYSHNLAQSGLSAFGLGTGTLPPGLSLTAQGMITGTPTQSGAFSFQFTASPSFAQLAQIPVSEEVSDGDVPLPGWALLLLGSGLMTALLRRNQVVPTK